jgi:hypothetical protein
VGRTLLSDAFELDFDFSHIPDGSKEETWASFARRPGRGRPGPRGRRNF